MAWPKGKPNPAAAERMRVWHQTQNRPEKPTKPSKSLHFLTPDERREYNTLRRYGCGRHDALVAVMSDAL